MKLRRLCSGIFCGFVAFLLIIITNDPLICFFSDIIKISGFTKTGTLEFSIENLKIERENGIVNLEVEENGDTGNSVLSIKISKAFSFSVLNTGSSEIKYNLNIGIVWDEDIGESGKLFLYPYSIDDQTIYNNIKYENYSDAIIGADVSDIKEIAASTGGKKGIFETVDNFVLQSAALETQNPEPGEDFEETEHFERTEDLADDLRLEYSETEGLEAENSEKEILEKNYSFKLFFYDDEEINLNPQAFAGKNIEVIISVNADVNERNTNWARTENAFFRVISDVDLTAPVIREVPGAKTFYITQTANINLVDYAVAMDDFDGIITDRIVITSSPEFNKDKAGSYIISFNVRNSKNNAARELQINIVIWDFVKIESGNYHSLALTSHGKVYAWGFNYYGQIGDGTTTYRDTPKLVTGLENIVDIAAGTGCSYALTNEGRIYAWGNNANGRLGDSTTTARTKPVFVVQPAEVKFIQISANYATAAAVTSDGYVYTWGYGGYGAAGTGNTNENREPTKINISNIAMVSMGYYNGVAVTNDGQVYTWGDNLHGQLGNGASMAVGTNAPAVVPYFSSQNIQIKQASAGWYHMIAISESGNVYTWGYGYEGRLGNNAQSDKNTPQPITLPDKAVEGVAAYYHTFVRTENNIYFFGQNAYGKHGSGNTADHLVPYMVSINNVTSAALALDSSFVLSQGKIVYGMGYGGTGVLGTGNSSNSNVPVQWAFIPPAPY